MSNREAMTIFENIESPDYEDGQKMLAIKTVIKMLLYNSVSQSSLAKAIRWLLPRCFDAGRDNSAKDTVGVCPVCGSNVTYTGEHEFDDSGGKYGWECHHCGASGEEGYNRAFDRHYNVADKDGNPVPGRPE